MKLLTRRYQTLPRYWTCRECPAGGQGGETGARAHTVITRHETRHVRAAEVIFRLPPDLQEAAAP
jgi:hypothetical protein